MSILGVVQFSDFFYPGVQAVACTAWYGEIRKPYRAKYNANFNDETGEKIYAFWCEQKGI